MALQRTLQELQLLLNGSRSVCLYVCWITIHVPISSPQNYIVYLHFRHFFRKSSLQSVTLVLSSFSSLDIR